MRAERRTGAADRRRRATALTCSCCGARFHTVALDLLGARLEAWAVGWEHDAWTDGTVLDVCPACVAEDADVAWPAAS